MQSKLRQRKVTAYPAHNEFIFKQLKCNEREGKKLSMHVYAIGIRPKLFGAYKNILNILCLLKKLPASSGLLKITLKKRYESGPMTFQLQLQQLTWPLNTKQKCRKKVLFPVHAQLEATLYRFYLQEICLKSCNFILRLAYSLGCLSCLKGIRGTAIFCPCSELKAN